MTLTKRLSASALAFATITVGASLSYGQSASVTATFKVGKINIHPTGELIVFADASGMTWQTPGTPGCPIGGISFHVNSAMVSHSDAVKERLLDAFLAAQLSGRKVNVFVSRGVNNSCFVQHMTTTVDY